MVKGCKCEYGGAERGVVAATSLLAATHARTHLFHLTRIPCRYFPENIQQLELSHVGWRSLLKMHLKNPTYNYTKNMEV